MKVDTRITCWFLLSHESIFKGCGPLFFQDEERSEGPRMFSFFSRAKRLSFLISGGGGGSTQTEAMPRRLEGGKRGFQIWKKSKNEEGDVMGKKMKLG